MGQFTVEWSCGGESLQNSGRATAANLGRRCASAQATVDLGLQSRCGALAHRCRLGDADLVPALFGGDGKDRPEQAEAPEVSEVGRIQ